MEMSNGFSLEEKGTAVIIRFTRPERRNPLSISVVRSLRETLKLLSDEVDSIIFTGSGSIFASGADLREIASIDASTSRGFAELGQQMMSIIDLNKRRTIAAINGICYGGALDLSLACDQRIASPNAEFCHPGGGLGIMTGWGGTQRLPRLVGESAALEMFLTGKKIDAREALKVGLLDKIADDPVEEAILVCLSPHPSLRHPAG